MNSEMDKTIPCLTVGEAFIYKWQYQMLGGFKTALAKAITKADMDNTIRLHKGFPDEVEAYSNFKGDSSWWKRIEAKVKTGREKKE